MLLLWIAGCGRLGFDPEQSPPGDGPPVVVVTDPSLAPTVCAASTLGTVALAGPPVDVTVTATRTGATLLWTPTGGGLFGLEVDAAGSVVGDPAGTQLRGDSWIHSIASTFANGALIVASQDDVNCIAVDVFATGLGAFQEIDHMPQTHASKMPIAPTAGGLILPTTFEAGTPNGVLVTPFDNSWTAQPTTFIDTSGPVTAIATASYVDDAVAAWSTASTCQITTITGTTPGPASLDLEPCAAPRLAASDADLMFVFESPSGVRAARGIPAELGTPGSAAIAPGSSSPRVIYDGRRYWIAFLDESWSLVVGYLDDNGSLHTTDLAITPGSRDYELAVVGGAPWVYAAADGRFTATELCVP
jgi:hypothetical protein